MSLSKQYTPKISKPELFKRQYLDNNGCSSLIKRYELHPPLAYTLGPNIFSSNYNLGKKYKFVRFSKKFKLDKKISDCWKRTITSEEKEMLLNIHSNLNFSKKGATVEFIQFFGLSENIKEMISKSREPEKSKDGRHTAKKDEAIRVLWISENINNKTLIGTKMCQDYFKTFGKHIERVEQKGSNSDHYDLLIYNTDGTTTRCEEKGSKTYRKIMDSFEIPWNNSVQRFNGIGKNFNIARKYAELWYDLIVSNKDTSTFYGIDISLIPTKEEWLRRDAFAFAPKTEWGLLLKKKHREMYPGHTSMNGKKGVPVDSREIVNPKFIFTENDKQILLKEALIKLNQIMNEKECWLQTSGNIEEPFNWQWHDKIESPKIKDIEMTWSKGADIYFHFIAENANFKGILRFGKGTGFSNIRFDIR